METKVILQNAKAVRPFIAELDEAMKNRALLKMAEELEGCSDKILSANSLDIEAARGVISEVMIDRLTLTRERIEGMAEGVRAVAALPDPVGKTLDSRERADGLSIKKVSVPIGTVAIIYESRPNVTSDAAALSFKSGNVCILRSGKEAYKTAREIVKALRNALRECGIEENMIQLIDDTSRKSATELMEARGFVDLLIPRGGKGLIKACVDNAKVPCIETGTGICHIYADKAADLNKAIEIIDNAKTSRPSVCNAAEVLLVAKDIAQELLPKLYERLVADRLSAGLCPVELRLCERSQKIIKGTPAKAEDFDTEFLDYILAVRIVEDVKEAAEHIALHSTGHSEAIITESREAADYFISHIDSAAVYENASTRFTDGGEFGLGCEMGISTQKLHARGPMGLSELTTYKYVIKGNGNIRA